MAKKKRSQRVPKGAKGLSLKPGQCRVLRTRVRVCVSKSGTIKVTPVKGYRKRKTAGKKRAPGKSRKKKTTRKRKGKSTYRKASKRCISKVFQLKSKAKGKRCACLVSAGKPYTYKVKPVKGTHASCKRTSVGPYTAAEMKKVLSGRKPTGTKKRRGRRSGFFAV